MVSMGGLAPKRSVVDDAKEATKRRVKTEVKETPKVDLSNNAFYKVVMDKALSLAQKKKAIAELATFGGTAEERKELERQRAEILEYSAEVCERMNTEIIKLTDTDAFSELQKSYKNFNGDMKDFEERIRPLTDMLDSLYRLGKDGKTYDVFLEIQVDKQAEAEREVRLIELDRAQKQTNALIFNKQAEIAIEKENVGWFNKKPKNPIRIATLEAELLPLLAKKEEIIKEQNVLRTPAETQLNELVADKEQLRKLLDLTSEEHKERQEELVNAALRFIENAKSNLGNVRQHMGAMDNQITNLFTVNNGMTVTYAVLNEGFAEAVKANEGLRQSFAPVEGEDMLEKVQRDQKRMAVEEHITKLNESVKDTTVGYANLAKEAMTIENMKATNLKISSDTRTLATQGVAGVAGRLSTVLQAVSAAALGEASRMSNDTLNRMNSVTDDIAQKEVMRMATGLEETSKGILENIGALEAWNTVRKEATAVATEALTDISANLDRLKSMATESIETAHDAVAIGANVNAEKMGKPKEEAKKNPILDFPNAA